jgi:hypothetical protein
MSSVPQYVLEQAIIRRRVVHFKAIETGDLLPIGGLVKGSTGAPRL